MTIDRTEILARSKTVTIWQRTLDLLMAMNSRSGMDSTEILSEAMRRALAECKTHAGVERVRTFQKKNQDAKERTGKSVPTEAAWSDVEFETLKQLLKDQELMQVAFVSYAVERHHERWAPNYVKTLPDLIQGPPPKKDEA